MKQEFFYHLSRKVIYQSIVYFALLVLVGYLLRRLHEGDYLSSWFLILMVAVVALLLLSFPRKIVVNDATMEILCLLDMTEIPLIEIASVRRVDRRQMRLIVPLIATCGFLGYFGYYFDLRNFERVVVYATEWNNLVEIEDIYEQRYYVSCDRADELVSLLQSRTKNR
jgi:hypothetical protein